MAEIPGQINEDAARREAERAVTTAMRRMAAAAGVEIHPPSGPDSTMTLASTDPDAAIRLAMMLQDSARQTLREYIRLARRVGETWEQIGEALRLRESAGRRGVPLAALAFDYAAGAARSGRERTFPWRCPSCTGLIQDAGPGGGHPEPGHEPGCPRLAALVAVHKPKPSKENRDD